MRTFFSRFWFPVALICLLVLAIPGLVLFLLNLFGQQGPVNRWLEGAFNLTYHIPIPWWGALLLLLVPLLLLLLYFLKLKRKPLAVPSTFLWRKSIEDLHVNSLLQWLRQNVLLLLQILAVLALIYGVMAFRLHGRKGESRYYILMIDNSASMSATDVLPTRLDWARKEALKEIDAATDNDFGMVLEFNSSAEIRQSFTSNRGLLRDAVKKIEQTERPTRIDEALSLADSRANPKRSGEDLASRPADEVPGKERTYVPTEGVSTDMHLFSDGRFGAVPDFNLGNLNVHYHAAGKLVLEAVAGAAAGTATEQLQPAPESSDNVAVVAFNASRDDRDPTKLEVFVGAKNYRTENVSTKVQLEVQVDGRLREIREQDLELPARKSAGPDDTGESGSDLAGKGAATFEVGDLDRRSTMTLHAKLVNVRDKFPLDDEAWLVVGLPRKARVLIVGPINEILQAFFDDPATREIATVKQLAPAELTQDAYLDPARNGSVDLVIFDHCGPPSEKDMPRANTFFIGYPPPPWKLQDTERLEFPHIKGWVRKSRVLRYLTALHEVGLTEAFRMKDLPPRTPRLIETDKDAAILLSLSRGPFTDLVMTFPILNDKGQWTTDWPKLPSFPLFLLNVLHALGNIPDTATEESVQPGQMKALRPDASVRELQVVNPEGKSQTLVHEDRDVRTDFSYGATDQVGIYQVSGNNFSTTFAVNLLDPDESNIEPRPTVQIGTERVAAGTETGQPRELWKWFALAALVILLAEWYIYNRRVYI